MNESDRTASYSKDQTQEAKLKALNKCLALMERQLVKSFSQPKLPLVFIVGVPRSGTTLLHQSLVETEVFTYISNFTARFWLTPYIGMMIEDALNIKKNDKSLSFSSDFGVTQRWEEPHEFGYFWSRWFGFQETHKLSNRDIEGIDRIFLSQEVAAIESITNKPILFKNLTCGLQIQFLSEIFPMSVFLVCHRHPLYNAQSLFQARKKILGGKNYWWSIRPKEYSQLISLSPYQQIAGQIYYTLKDIEENLRSISPQRYLHIEYEKLCAEPRLVVKEVIELIRQLGAKIEGNIEYVPDQFGCQNIQKISDYDFINLQQALAQYQ